MKPHPRIRKTAKWGGAVVTVLLAVVWLGSGWYLVRWGIAPGWAVFTECGRCDVVYAPHFYNGHGAPSVERREGPGASRGPAPFRLGWRYFHGLYGKPTDRGGQEEHWWVPHWPFVAIAAFVTVLGWGADFRASRRARLNCCPKCNYDRTGLAASTVCPECGSKAGGGAS